jgi:DNA polymerase-3 subunit epsilon
MDNEKDFIAIDFETANEKRSSACSIGLTVVRDGEIVDSFSRLIRPPELRFSRWNSNIHGLKEEDVKDAPTLDQVWPELLPLVENQLVVAHNASFDISVLRHSLHAVKVAVPRIKYLCSHHIARFVWPEFVSHSLGYVALKLDIPLSHHEAESDSRACAEIIRLALARAEVTTVGALAHELDISFGELLSAEDWTPVVAPTIRSNRETLEIEIPPNFDIPTHEFFGKTVVFTGTLQMFSRRDALNIVEQFGGIPSETVSKKTSYLIIGEQDVRMLAKGETESSKLRKAKTLRESGCDIKIISESDFSEMIFSPTKARTS